MTGLLVSVRNASEATAAVHNGAAIVDVKEPAHGSLGAAAPFQWREVLQACPAGTAISVALGELLDQPLAWRLASLPPVAYAKFGLAGCRHRRHWQSRWAWAIRQLPPETAPVAVIYADATPAAAPQPATIISLAHQLGCRAVLWDTFHKNRGNLLDQLSRADLSQQIQSARQADLMIVLAGSLTWADLPHIEPLAPDFVAVRGAVCEPDRSGMLRGYRVRQLATCLNAWSSAPLVVTR